MSKKKVHIIGGGVIGLCSAWYLKRAGIEVVVVDGNDGTDGTSFGNAGMIVPSHFVPMAAPGVIAQGMKWLFNSKSPFSIKPRMDLDLIQWLWHFNRSANAKQVASSMPVLYELNERSKSLYREMSQEDGLNFGFEERGLLMLYKSKKQAEEEEALAEKAAHLNVKAEILDGTALKRLEPEMDLDVLGGIYFPGDAHLYPNQLMNQLSTRLRELGVEFLYNTSIVDINSKGSKIDSLITSEGEIVPVETVLLTAGSWSGKLLKKAGITEIIF